jgi:hypothetical protein
MFKQPIIVLNFKIHGASSTQKNSTTRRTDLYCLIFILFIRYLMQQHFRWRLLDVVDFDHTREITLMINRSVTY